MVKQYEAHHKILLVGEGDFSFALCLARSFWSGAANIVATSLDSYDTVIGKYKHAKSNIDELRRKGAVVLHEVDAEIMKLHPDLMKRHFHRIIYNFPHAGFYGKEDDIHMIRMHQKLVNGFFNNAAAMLGPHGEIHVTHKTYPPYTLWDLQGLALRNNLIQVGVMEFKITDYPGYNNKRGDGLRCDDPFPLGAVSTFKFAFRSTTVDEEIKIIIRRRRTPWVFGTISPLTQVPPTYRNRTGNSGGGLALPIGNNLQLPPSSDYFRQRASSFVHAREKIATEHNNQPNPPSLEVGNGLSTRMMGFSPPAQCPSYDLSVGGMGFGVIDHVDQNTFRAHRRRHELLVSLYGSGNC